MNAISTRMTAAGGSRGLDVVADASCNAAAVLAALGAPRGGLVPLVRHGKPPAALMHGSLRGASDALEARLAAFQKRSALSPAEGLSGMVVALGDGPLHPSRGNVGLQVSRVPGAGARVRLDVSSLPDVFLYPGQLLSVRGRMLADGTYAVSSIVDSDNDAILPQDESSSGSVLVAVAAGPYGERGALHTLDRICMAAGNAGAALLLLLGPFCAPEGDGAPDDEWAAVPGRVLSAAAARFPEMHVALIPAPGDLSATPVLPQEWTASGIDARLRNAWLLRSPEVFSLSGLSVSVCAADVLLAMASRAYAKTSDPWDALADVSLDEPEDECTTTGAPCDAPAAFGRTRLDSAGAWAALRERLVSALCASGSPVPVVPPPVPIAGDVHALPAGASTPRLVVSASQLPPFAACGPGGRLVMNPGAGGHVVFALVGGPSAPSAVVCRL